PASQAQAINYSWAITLTLMAALFLGQRIRKQDWIACALSYFGGVDTDCLSSKTMECKTVKGLFFIGEVMDVTGWLGGYNFQWA
ncbi:NAD(P)/FAD-dependent oxidoreductase, partial [Vibrio cholerae]|uniref:NAD(P)/FAD-dependent oxidoreductase n=1 Tax=Vibrio cholerae TaxID=666 RepID=UPI0030801816